MVAPYGPRHDADEALPPQEMGVSSSVDNLQQLAWGELGSHPAPLTKTAQTHERLGAGGQLQEGFTMDVPTLRAKVQTQPSRSSAAAAVVAQSLVMKLYGFKEGWHKSCATHPCQKHRKRITGNWRGRKRITF